MTKEERRDRIRGCMFGGAVGDALGYPIEFLKEYAIFEKYGKEGITSYDLPFVSGLAEISDDTQMCMFTACGMLNWDTERKLKGDSLPPCCFAERAYEDWYNTQDMFFEDFCRIDDPICFTWLSKVEGLYSRRAPGMTCLGAMSKRKREEEPTVDYTSSSLNDSKGCGGIMRVAPVALMDCGLSLEEIDNQGAQIAAITHSHSLGYITAAALAHIIRRLVFPENDMTLKEIVLEARDAMEKMFAGDEYLKENTEIIDRAIALSENQETDLDNIHKLGEGWVAEETLGIAIYCALRYQDDFSKGIIAAVNHNGDSDSTGAVTGNILGALLGYDAIEEKWKQDLELKDEILELADDLYSGCPSDETLFAEDTRWNRKYIQKIP